jgi:hypothetical protein
MYRYQPNRIAHAVRKHSTTVGLGLALAFFVYAKSHPHQMDQWWFSLILGAVLFAIAMTDIRSRSATLFYSTVKRVEDPVGYWTAVAISGCLGIAAITVGLGQVVGLWTI